MQADKKIFESVQKRFLKNIQFSMFCWNWKLSTGSHGYGQLYDGRIKRPATTHTLAWELFNGESPKGKIVDHRCYNKRCVNPMHLRLVSKSENTQNLGEVPSNNTSGHRGVFLDVRRDSWAVQVQRQHGGYFPLYELHIAGYYARLKRMELFTCNDKDRLDLMR